MLDARQKAVAARARQQQRDALGAGKVMQRLRAGVEVDQRGDGLAVATRTRQVGHRHGVDAPVAAEHQEVVHGATFKRAVQPVARLEGKARRLVPVALARPHPAFFADHHRHRLVDHFHLGHGALFGLDQRAARVGKLLGVAFDLLDHQAAQAGRAAQNVFQAALLLAQLGQFLLDLDGFEPRQLAQADVEDVISLDGAEVEARDQRRLRLVAVSDDRNHLVDVQQHQLPAFEDVDAVQHLLQAMLAAARDGLLAELDPLHQHLPQRLLRGAAVQADAGQVDRGGCFQAGVRQQRVDQLILPDGAAFGLEHDAHRRVLARFVAHLVQHRQHGGLELVLLLRHRLLAGLDLGVGQFLDFFQHLLRRGAGRQFGHDQLPLAARQVFDLPARTHFQAAAAAFVRILNVTGGADDLPAARIVGTGDEHEQLFIGQFRVLDERHAGIGHFAQVVARDFGRQADGDAAGAIEQRKRQACGQLARLLLAAVVVGLEINRAFVNLFEQQARDFGQARLGVAHGRGAVAVAAAEVALAVDERVPLAEILRHAHQRVVSGAVAVRVVLAQHIAHHAGAFDRRGGRVAAGAAVAQTHALHGV